MEENLYNIKISPETISGDIFKVCYPSGATYDSGCTYVYSSMTSILSGGTNGDSLLTGLTIPILITENAVDLGYYSVFDGAIMQADVVKNFIFSATTGSPYVYYFYNTSEHQLKNYLQLSSYTIDWGDGVNTGDTITTYSPNYISHDYTPFGPGQYTITLKQKNPWGVNTVKKTITVPYTGITINNPNGTAYFTPNIGSWSATPISYDFIFSGDAVNQISAQTSNNYVSVPFIISGYTSSRITELQSYGSIKYVPYVTIGINSTSTGVINTISPTMTAYTIDDVVYYDFIDGTTVYILNSSGLTDNWMVQEAITKDESLLNIVYEPEIQSDIYIERGKNSALERVERIGEVNSIGSLVNYGYGFFNVVQQ
jgi:hypothetical protein